MEAIKAEVKEVGNGAHLTMPKEWLGRNVVVMDEKSFDELVDLAVDSLKRLGT